MARQVPPPFLCYGFQIISLWAFVQIRKEPGCTRRRQVSQKQNTYLCNTWLL